MGRGSAASHRVTATAVRALAPVGGVGCQAHDQISVRQQPHCVRPMMQQLRVLVVDAELLTGGAHGCATGKLAFCGHGAAVARTALRSPRNSATIGSPSCLVAMVSRSRRRT